MNSSVGYKNAPTVATAGRVTWGWGKVLAGTPNRNANTAQPQRPIGSQRLWHSPACPVTDSTTFPARMTVPRCSSESRCECSTFDPPQKVSPGACDGSVIAELLHQTWGKFLIAEMSCILDSHCYSQRNWGFSHSWSSSSSFSWPLGGSWASPEEICWLLWGRLAEWTERMDTLGAEWWPVFAVLAPLCDAPLASWKVANYSR